MKLFVGIDVSSQELEACFMNSDGDKLETLKVKNDLAHPTCETVSSLWRTSII
uniref:IS110 family transposase n=1 Tax=Cohnella kolymensis TaxID=1590652 RepID=UPI000A773E97|nr:IS110 family transposase [Cohnella kolymensis]